MQLTVSPADGLVDEVPSIAVRGLRPGEPVTVRVEVTDAAGVRWESANHYTADALGAVDTATGAPGSGTYTGVDAGGPWWSMAPTAGPRSADGFTPCADLLTWGVTGEPARSGPAEHRTLVRRWRARRVSRLDSTRHGLRLARFSPAEPDRPPPAVVMVPGTAGAGDLIPAAALLASRCGFTTTVLGYAGGDGRTAAPRELPVERLARGIAAEAYAAPGGVPVAVVAHSTGTAGALAALALEHVPVEAVVVVAPSHVVWQTLTAGGLPPATSEWSHHAVPLPFVPLGGQRLLPAVVARALLRRLPDGVGRTAALRLRPLYAAGLRDLAAVDAAGLPVERIAAPLMAVAGTADGVWPAEDMARALIARHRASSYDVHGPDGDVLLVNRGAGHLLRPPLVPTTVDRADGLALGGSPAADARAERGTWTAMIRFLGRHLDRS